MSQKNPNPFAQRHLPRYIKPNMLYHVISRCFQGRMLLTPDREQELEKIIYGVMAKAKERYTSISLYNFAVLSNHGHWILSAKSPKELPLFMGYVKREISRRWGPRIGWNGALWETSGYEYSALPTEEARLWSFRYVLAQGTKEGLVEAPTQWPGAHGAHFWLAGYQALKGQWFNGTRYSRAKQRAKERSKERPLKELYYESCELRLSVLPALENKTGEERDRVVQNLERSIVEEARREHQKKPVLGVEKIFAQSRTAFSTMPKIPWMKRRATIVTWADQKATLVKEYIEEFWAFQRKYRDAATRHAAGIKNVVFPDYAWAPGRFI